MWIVRTETRSSVW